MTSILYFSLLVPATGNWEPVDSLDLAGAIAEGVISDGDLVFDLGEGEAVCVSTEPGCEGATIGAYEGLVWVTIFDLVGETYEPVGAASLLLAVESGALVFESAEGEVYRASDGPSDEGASIYATQE